MTIPAEYRRRFGIKVGDVVTMLLEGDRIVIIPAKKRRVIFRAGRPVAVEELEKAVESARD